MIVRFLLLIVFLFLSQPGTGAGREQDKTSSAANGQVMDTRATDTGPTSPEIPLDSINERLAGLPKKLIDLDLELTAVMPGAKIRKQLDEITDKLDELTWQVTIEKTDPALNYQRLAATVFRVNHTRTTLARMREQVQNVLALLAGERQDWSEEQSRIAAWEKRAEKDPGLRMVLDSKKEWLATCKQALGKINGHLQDVLALSHRIDQLDLRAYRLDRDLDRLALDLKNVKIQQTSPSLLSSRFFQPLSTEDLFQKIRHNAAKGFRAQLDFFLGHLKAVLSAMFSLVLLSLAISASRPMVSPASSWHGFSSRPLATSLVLLLSLYILHTLFVPARGLPAEVADMIYIVIILALLRLSKILVRRWWYRHFLIPLALILISSFLLQIIDFPSALRHLYIFLVCLIGLTANAGYLLRHGSRLVSWHKWSLGGTSLLCLVIVGAELTGFSSIALYLFRSFLYNILAGMVFWILYLLSAGLLDLVLSRLPVRFLQRNRPVIIGHCRLPLRFFFLFLFGMFSLVVWQVHPTLMEAISSITSLELRLGGLILTPGYLIRIIAVVWLSLMTSKMLQALLLQEVLPRYGAEIGVQLSITRLVHYAVLVIGFLILLRILGLELTKLAILGGALGVGIGFGLQAIVNNFASGLILLFERPLKVGDMIEVGEEMGEVKRLGLRATVVRTFDNAEIVIPNSDLITGPVTNWTLANRSARVKVPVGVAYGTDIAQVLRILLDCAKNNPLVLSTPPPKALFLAFGPSSLDFELRVWISEFTDRREALSTLNQEIAAEFASAGIEIPFPQSDLHLRSLDPSIAGILSDQGRNDAK